MRAPRLRTSDERGLARQALAAAMLANTLAVLPVFLLGSLAVLVRRDLDFGEVRLGLAAAAFSAASALFSVFGGRLAQRVGAVRAMTLGVCGSAGALVGIAVLARSWLLLVVLLMIGGVGSAIAQPGTNLALARAVPEARQGLAYGIKQASVPLATLTAGLAVPVVGQTVGWRWGFAGAALVAVVFVVVVPKPSEPVQRHASSGPRGGGADTGTGPLLLLAAAATAAAASNNALGAFYVESAVSRGLSSGLAGFLLAAGGLSGITGRVLWGWQADRRDGRHLPRVAVLLLGGACGSLLLAYSSGRMVVLAAGTVLAFAAGWGWPGLFNFAVVRHNRSAPAAATGITQTGVYVGAVIGPPGFGWLVEHVSYTSAWLAAAGALIVAACLVTVGRRAVLTDVARRGAGGE